MLRDNISRREEIKDIIIADAVLILAFSLTLDGGIEHAAPFAAFAQRFVYLLPIVAMGVSLSFVLHELMHKFVAERYGAIAAFRTSHMGLLITLATGFFGFLLGIPGATMIYTSKFTRKEEGLVSIAGPLTNFVVFAAFLVAFLLIRPPLGSYLYEMFAFTIFISILLAFFNMLPVPPLDGSKVLHWNSRIYLLTMGIIFVLMFVFTGIPLDSIVLMVFIALMFSLFYRNVL
ncbi:MAG: site-2 protease family protein [Candidatus Marsarchaeota archaeon]|jgi:Zn-dependent protease|nr:site-2 protease family protein [Candidatus Marsarchaeota archaeon]MCL5419079.1 site-2 protease family protein [Candidatus Marsarchaeota archaeon]